MTQQVSKQDSIEASQTSVYETLVYNLFQPEPQGHSRSTILAFTSALPKEGVSTVVHSVFNVLARNLSTKAVHLSMDWLKEQPLEKDELAIGQGSSPSPWMTNWDHRRRVVHQLRSRFRYVGVDCPALANSSDVLGLAPLVDGLVLVVEADRTTKPQIRNAERQIEAAGGKILGLILNKRRYPVPEILYHHF